MYANGSQISLWCGRWSDETSQQGKVSSVAKEKEIVLTMLPHHQQNRKKN